MRSDPDRPLLRLLNWAHGKPVLAMCGLPGSHDPAHAAAGRLPVRFNKYSDVRLYWREFSGGYRTRTSSDWRSEWQRRFVALIVLTNAGNLLISPRLSGPIVDLRSVNAIMDFRDGRKPVLWGEASFEGAVMWRPEFHIARIETGDAGPPEFIAADPAAESREGVSIGGVTHLVSHYQLVEGPA